MRLNLGLCLLTVASLVIFSPGCGGGNMSKLKQLAAARKAAGKKGDSEDEEPSKPPVSNQSKPQAARGSDADAKQESGLTNKGATKAVTEKNMRTGRSDDPAFAAFKAQLRKKYEERSRNLTTVKKIEAVASAFAEYVRLNRMYPPRAVPKNSEAFSWRIELLPYLGYQELYDQIDQNSRYSSPINRRLADLMPPEFQLSDRTTKTSFVAPICSYSAYWREQPSRINRIEDGVSDTVGVVLVDDEFAVNWMQPKEYSIEFKEPMRGLTEKYGFAIVIFGDGRVEKVSKSGKRQFNAMLSYDKGDKYSQTVVSMLEESDLNPAAKSDTAASTSTVASKSGDPVTSKGNVSTIASRNNGGASSTSTGPTNATAAQLAEASLNALMVKDQTAAFNFEIASKLLSARNGKAFSDFKWCQALQRPVRSLRWSAGISIDPNAKTIDPLKRANDQKLKSSRPGSKLLDEKTGQIGPDAMIVLRQSISQGRFGQLLLENQTAIHSQDSIPRRGSDRDRDVERNTAQPSNDEQLFDSRKKPFLHFSGIEVHEGPSRNYNLQVARARGNDLLLLFDVQLRPVNSETMNITTMYLIDVQRGKELWKSPPFNSLKIRMDRENALKKDPVFESMLELDAFCRKELSLTEIPVKLSRDNVLGRLKVLKGRQDANKLPFLAEARFYLDENLILLDDYKQFCIEVLGSEKAGLQFALGDPSQQYPVIRKFLDLQFSMTLPN